MQIFVAYFFFNAHWNQVTATLSDSVASEISVAVQLYNQSQGKEQAIRLDNILRPHMELSVDLWENRELPEQSRSPFFSILDQTLRRALNDNLESEFWFDTTRYPNHIDIQVKVDQGVLRFIAARERVFAPTGFVFMFWLFTATVLLTFICILFIRNQARPIAKLADAADAFGKGQDVSNFRPSGASEVRLAGHSFLKMRQRIRRHIEQRAILLAGVSHDLRTPLTRLRLHLAMQKESEERLAAQKDLEEMEAMLEAYLDFARDLPGETSVNTNIKSYLRDITGKYKFDKINLNAHKDIFISIKPNALKRALSNLISNALKYGDTAYISYSIEANMCKIHVEDDGPGIDENQYQLVIRPFHRLDTARNQNIEGVGLGLAITRDIAQRHGGELILDRSKFGGLKATINLPR